jgi:hypothetical protein
MHLRPVGTTRCQRQRLKLVKKVRFEDVEHFVSKAIARRN